MDGLAPGTLLQHFAEETKLLGAVTPPIFQNSLFVFETSEALSAQMQSGEFGEPHVYSRISNPTVEIVERKIAMLEGADAAKVASSGMAAATWGIMSAIKAGDHVVAVDTIYGPTKQLLTEYLPKFDISCTYVDGRDPSDIFDAVTDETTLVCVESPSSLMMRLQDLAAIATFCKERGITTFCDNTYATPLHQRPHDLGIDLVMHTATKYFGGHSDVVAGSLSGSKERMHAITHSEVALFGSILAPITAWLLLRGMRTLEIRLDRSEASANALADYLFQQPQLDILHHVSHESFPQRALYQRQMSGSGGLFSWEPKNQDEKAVRKFVDDLKIFQRGVSWGGFESLCIPSLVQPLGYPEARWVIRHYCGLEDPKDLIEDVRQSLTSSGL